MGKATVRVIREGKDFAGVVLNEDGSKTILRGSSLEGLWSQLLKEASKGSPDYFGYQGARERFLHFFPHGFASNGYEQKEGSYKRKAKELLDRTAPLERAVDGSGFGDAVLEAYRKTDLVDPRFERRKVEKVLLSADADDFVRAIAKFALEPNAATLRNLETLLRPHEAAAWTIVT